MPASEFADELHAEKYRTQRESFRESMSRVAGAVTGNQQRFQTFRDILLEQRFLPGGRNQAALGSTRNVTPYNCFVSGIIEDSFVDGAGSIMMRALEAAATMRMGGGIGYDFSTLRPRGALIKKLDSLSSGPVSFMDIFNAVCRCTASSGHRRGAQMGVLRVDHPDIEEFIHAKQNSNCEHCKSEGRLTGFNISVGVTDEFMLCVEQDKPFELRWGGEVYRTIDARRLWDTIMRSTWDWAEPGVLFIDRLNEMNNLYYCETLTTTNPCGEQPLPPFGACLLGSFNLVKYIERTNYDSDWGFDWGQLRADIPVVVRAMDNVVDVATYPLFEQEKEAKDKRRMGLGVTGVANALEALGHPYGSDSFVFTLGNILEFFRDECYRASMELAKEKGSFPAFDRNAYIQSEFVKKLPSDLIASIARHGIRNSHLTSIAPTGTISMCADNVSSGIEPVMGFEVERVFQTFDGPKTLKVYDYGKKFLGVEGRTVRDVTVDEHLVVLSCATKYMDSAVSKTVNVPEDADWDTFKEVYTRAWKAGCKGITTYRLGGKREGILKISEESSEMCKFDPDTGLRECD